MTSRRRRSRAWAIALNVGALQKSVTFWDFFDVLYARVSRHVRLSGTWPYGVFGRDPTEALIQCGDAYVISSDDECGGAKIVLRIPGCTDRSYFVRMSAEMAAAIGDDVGLLLSGMTSSWER